MTRPPISSVPRGILFMLLAVCLFACMNTLVKLLSPHFSSVQIVWARTLGHLIFVLALFLPRHGRKRSNRGVLPEALIGR